MRALRRSTIPAMVDSAQTLETLRSHADEIRTRFGVRQLSVFGSVARGEARADSDVDVLVDFDGDTTFDGFMGLRCFLEDLLSRKIDLVTRRALRTTMRPKIESEAIRVA